MSRTDNPVFLEALAAQTRADEERAAQQPTLRDRFAMAALTALIPRSIEKGYRFSIAAVDAYKYADAMMEVRYEPSAT